MPQPIRTKWHKLFPLIEEDKVWLTAPPNGTSKHWGSFSPNKERLVGVLRQMSSLPRFVIDGDLMNLIFDNDYQRSLLDMQRANVLRLPFPALIMEFPKRGGTALVMLRDNHFKERLPWEEAATPGSTNDQFWSQTFYGIPFRLETDNKGEYLVIPPGIIGINVVDQDGTPWVSLMAQGHDILESNKKELTDLIGLTYTKEASVIWQALAGAFLLMHTEGTKREIIDCRKVNRTRISAGREPIPTHTLISIGRVYRNSGSNESDEYIARRSPRPHWRRGHIKTVHHGKGRASVRQVYINPRLVAYKEFEGAEPPAQEYHVKA